MPSRTLVFVPAWNEEQNLPAVLGELHRELPDADVLVVDDGSTDRTADLARGHGAQVVSFGENRGLRAGIAAGYEYAAEHGYDYCGRVDADGQHPPSELRRLLAKVEAGECDVAVGSRFASGEGFEAERYEPTPVRRFGTGLLRRSMTLALGRPFHDATSGMYAANAKALPVLARPYTSGAPEVEAILRLDVRGAPRRGGAGRDARARGRRVEAPGEEGGRPRPHRHRHVAHGRVPAPPKDAQWLSASCAVLGYSGRDTGRLHPICASRLAFARQLAGEEQPVILSGWARRPAGRSEAELMREAWPSPRGQLVLRPNRALDGRQRRERGRGGGRPRRVRSSSSSRRAGTGRAPASCSGPPSAARGSGSRSRAPRGRGLPPSSPANSSASPSSRSSSCGSATQPALEARPDRTYARACLTASIRAPRGSRHRKEGVWQGTTAGPAGSGSPACS